jgi:lactoylglutathione lyase
LTLICLTALGDLPRAGADKAPAIERTYDWDPENYGSARSVGHLAFEIENTYDTHQRLQDGGVAIDRPPRQGRLAFVRSADFVSVELLQKGPRCPPRLGNPCPMPERGKPRRLIE